MKKHFLSISALYVAIMLSAFETTTHESQNQNVKQSNFNWYYFQFVGIRNCEEADRTKWQLMPYVLYLMQPCNATHYGCKLIATEVELIDGVTRPKQIYIDPGTNDPKPGAFVISVSNHQN